MKIRTDFVSNSSSSSFILAKNDLLLWYGVTKKDITDALASLYGKAKYRKYINSKWNTSHTPPFQVYVMPDDQQQALKDYGMLLSEWNASRCHESWFVGAEEQFSNLLNLFSNAYNACLYNGTDQDINWAKKHKELPDFVAETVKDIRKRLGIMSAKEALKKNGWIFVHFDENEIHNLAGVMDYCTRDVESWAGKYMTDEEKEKAKTSPWTTEHGSIQRIFEVILAKLVKMRKIKLNDAKALAEINPADEQAKKDFPGCKSAYLNDVYTAEDLVDESLIHWNGHEG